MRIVLDKITPYANINLYFYSHTAAGDVFIVARSKSASAWRDNNNSGLAYIYIYVTYTAIGIRFWQSLYYNILNSARNLCRSLYNIIMNTEVTSRRCMLFV